MTELTARAPVNIAVIKYWGKRDETLLLPLNSSLSGTLDVDDMCSTTTVRFSAEYAEDKLWLNGEEENLTKKRMVKFLADLRARATNSALSGLHFHARSVNNFPTAAGLASSASGFACLSFVLCELLGVQGERSAFARLGSGSATRSLYGGFVKWVAGTDVSGVDSIAVPVAPETHWPEMRVLIAVASAHQKQVSSAEGMQWSVATSSLLRSRVANDVEPRMRAMEAAIAARDFAAFAQLTMVDSDQFHAVCADTQPPIFYMNDTSKDVLQLLRAYNAFCGRAVAAYTFDAGPNACIYLLAEHLAAVVGLLAHYFPPTRTQLKGTAGEPYLTHPEWVPAIAADLTNVAVDPSFSAIVKKDIQPGKLQRLILTKLGPGPQILSNDVSLLK